jgi:hypothetical protein
MQKQSSLWITSGHNKQHKGMPRMLLLETNKEMLLNKELEMRATMRVRPLLLGHRCPHSSQTLPFKTRKQSMQPSKLQETNR